MALVWKLPERESDATKFKLLYTNLTPGFSTLSECLPLVWPRGLVSTPQCVEKQVTTMTLYWGRTS